MSLTDYVFMPGTDYQDICNAVRAKTGKTDLLKSGDLAPEIEDYTSDGTAEAQHIADGMIAYSKNKRIVGSMTDQGSIDETLDIGTLSHTITPGLYSGGGTVKIVPEEKTATPKEAAQEVTPTAGKVLSKVKVNPIPSNYKDTSDADATAQDMAENKTGYVGGKKVTGSVPVQSGIEAQGATVTHDATGGTIDLEIDHTERVIVDPGTLKLKTPISNFGAARPEDVLDGETFTSESGLRKLGTMPNNGSVNDTITANGSYRIAKGYHDGNGSLKIAVPLDGGIDTTDSNATAEDIALGAIAFVKNEKIIGNVVTLKSGETLNGDSSGVSFGESGLTQEYDIPANRLLRQGSKVSVTTPGSNLGDASPEDVAAGKTFTSASGLKIDGTNTFDADTQDGDATAEDIVSQKAAYVKGEKVIGTRPKYTQIIDSNFADDTGVYVGKVSGTDDITRLTMGFTAKKGAAFDTGTLFRVSADFENFGDATAEDVTKGKTFTSAAGLKVVGTAEPVASNDNCEAYHITSASTALSFKRTDGTIKVWGYGYKSSGTYSSTVYAFVGDGYYASTTYGTPSKTSATFSLGSNGVLSGLPSGLTAVNIIVTKGI